MYRTTGLVALAATFSTALAAYQGFNYGSTFTTGAAKAQPDFEAEFKAAQGLTGTDGTFTSARLYTMIQAGTASDPISAIPAALSTKTSLLLGIWCSAGDAVFANELQALKSAITKYGDALGPLVAGISVGNEDLYRITPTGIANNENPGAGPDVIAKYIKQVKDAIAGTPLSKAPVGHVDTWTAWVNGSNKAAIDACDWIGFDAYPYFQTTMANSIENGKSLFNDALGATKAAVGGKPVWITETGWPVSGKTSGSAVPSVENAKTYWDQVYCPLLADGKTPVWWFTLQDAAPGTPNPSFGLVGDKLSGAPLYDLSCANVDKGSSAQDVSSNPSSSAASQASSSGSTSLTLAGGSPGASGAAPSSQISLESTATGGTGGPAETGSGSGKPGNSNAGSSGRPSATASPSGAGVKSGSLGAAFAAVMVAILAF